jgi:DNA-binding beta-propeller fold protein YncE
MKTIVTSVLLLGVACLVRAGEVNPAKFTSKPTVRGSNGKRVISFAVSAPTDVEVAILDAGGKVVRHLAAGVLGENPPAPLKKGLKQELVWDGKDDSGKPVSAARVRVSLGMRPRLEKTIGDNPAVLGGVRGLAVGPGGELFVFHVYGALHPNDGTGFCTVFTREGKYLRTILPYPANLPDEKLAGLRRVALSDGRKVPYIWQGETRTMLQGVGDLPVHRPVVASDGRVAFVGHEEWCKSKLRYNRCGPNRVTVIRSDGSVPEPPLRCELDDFSAAGGGVLALSPDEKTIYATRVLSGYKGRHHAVYKCAWADQKKPGLFLGQPRKTGSGKDGFKNPWSVAVDAAGNVYVSDRGNNRVAVFKPDGAHLGDLDVQSPDQICVHRKTGALYLTAGAKGRKLLKFPALSLSNAKSWKDAGPVCELKLPFFDRDSVSMLALDDRGDKPVLWYSSPRSWHAGRFAVLRVEDLGAKFGDAVKMSSLRERKGVCAGSLLGLALQRGTGKLLVNSRCYDTGTGKWSRGLRANHGTKGGVGWFGLDGRFYSQHYSRNLARYGVDLKPMPFGGRKELTGPEGGTTHLRGRGVTADASGRIYCIWQEKGASHFVRTYDAKGEVKTDRIIDSKIRGIQSVRVDAAGNIYLAVCVRPEGVKAPKELAAMKLGTSWHSKMPTSEINWYELLYGCIVKFPPRGGAIKDGDGVPMEYGIQDKRKRHTRIKGAKWIYFGASPFVTWRQPFPDSCICEGATFDVDLYGRAIFPDAARFRVGVLDSGGNEICFFGDYGNADSAGKGSKIPGPEIPVLWPYMVEAGDGVVYVGDRLNRRVLQIKLEHAVSEEVGIN